MKKHLFMSALVLMLCAPLAQAADEAASAAVAKSPEQIAAEVRIALTKEKIHHAFDLFRRLEEHGVSWQPSLVAPDDLVDKLDDEGLRLYAGVKLFDAIYALTFRQRLAMSEAILTIEAINDKLNLRAYADLNGSLLATLKRAAANPESVDIQSMLEQLSADYVQEIPNLMAGPEGADYLIDGFYGFIVESSYILGQFFEHHDRMRLIQGMRLQPDRSQSLVALVELFQAFDRMDDAIRVGGETTEKLAVIQQMIATIKSNPDADASRLAWQEIRTRVKAIRASILTPTAG